MEALDTISALSYALQPLSPIPSSPRHQAQPPLKLSLFNLNRYIREEEFSHEFMLKGGMQLLVKLLSIHDHSGKGGFQTCDAGSEQTAAKGNTAEVLTGNMLAVSALYRSIHAAVQKETDQDILLEVVRSAEFRGYSRAEYRMGIDRCGLHRKS